MGRLTIYCHSCTHWEWDKNIIAKDDGRVVFVGHCGLYSCRCVNAVVDGEPAPPYFQSLEETINV